jgi:hypothetical protein
VRQNKEDVMSIDGIIIGAIAFLVIGVFHPLVTYVASQKRNNGAVNDECP